MMHEGEAVLEGELGMAEWITNIYYGSGCGHFFSYKPSEDDKDPASR